MVVLDTSRSNTSPVNMSQYIQPPPMEFDSKCSPLAMLTQACNKIESNLMGEGCPLPSSRRTLSSSSSSTSPSCSAAVNNNNGNLLKSHLKLETFSSGLVARPKSSSTSISSLSHFVA
ncbi:uncharacterized protein LOC131889119 [Tigriopus californicus]|nr:uncharacterized protein LOC131889119 [Tigriopus californicus]